MHYTFAYYTHISCVTISLGWFLVRGFWMIRGDATLEHRLHQTGPHFVDTLLLGSALYLATTIQQYPFQVDWLTAKVAALVVYIVLGAIALKRGKTKRIRVIALALSVATACYIIKVALTKSHVLSLTTPIAL